MADVFISYSRSDIAFARKLHAGLTEVGLETWIDWQDIAPSTDWMAEIQESIEQADAFIFVISGKSADSEVCSREVNYAFENSKRLIPIVIDDIDPASLPPYIAALNWIFFRERDDFDASMKRLLEAITLDQEWVKAHTRYQNRALEWDRSGQASAYLLRGSDLQEAETWLTQAKEKDPPPTALQREYILSSRRSLAKRQRMILAGLAIGLTLALILSAFAFMQRGVAIEQRDLQATAEGQAVAEAQIRATAEAIAVQERDARATAQAESQVQRDVAISQYLAAESSAFTKYKLERKLLVALEAFRFSPTVEARGSLVEALTADPYFSGFVMRDEDYSIRTLTLSWDGTRLVIGSESSEIRVLDAQSGVILHTLHHPSDETGILQLALSSDSRHLVSVDERQHAILWDLGSKEPQGIDLSSTAGWESFLAINQDGSEVAGITTDGDVAIWDTGNRSIILRLEASSREVGPLIFSPDGKNIAAFHAKKEIHLWRRADGKLLPQTLALSDQSAEPITNRHQLNGQYTMAFNAKGDALVVGDGHKTFYWQITENKIVSTRSAYFGGFNAQDQPMAFAHTMFKPYQLDILSGKSKLGPLEFNQGYDPFGPALLGYAWNPRREDCFFIWKEDLQGTLILRYNFSKPSPILTSIPNSLHFRAVATDPSPASDLMITAGCGPPYDLAKCSQGLIQFWDSRSGFPLGDPIRAHADKVNSVAISPDGARFATASADGTVHLWDLEARVELGDPIVFQQPSTVDNVRFHPKGSVLAVRAITTPDIFGIHFIDLESREHVGEPLTLMEDEEEDSILTFAFSPQGDRMVVTQAARLLSVWDITRLEKPVQLYTLEVEGLPHAVTFHPEGDRIAYAMRGAAMLIDARTGEILYTPQQGALQPGAFHSIAYSPDGKWIAVMAKDDIQLSDGTSGIPLGSPLRGPEEIISFSLGDSLAFSSDATKLISVNHLRGIMLWNLDFAEAACRMISRELTEQEIDVYLDDVAPLPLCPQKP